MILGLLGAALIALKSTVVGKAVVGGIINKFLGGAAKDAAGGAAGGAARSTTGGAARSTTGGVAKGKASGPGFLEKLGKGLGELGKGIGTGVGKLIENLLTGLANGLKALGNPKVLFGAANLLIVSAALYVTAKAVTEFGNANWEDLAKAGVALVGLGLAGAAAGLVAPLMLLGAAGFAAMGAALWVIGKAVEVAGPALKTLAEGLTEIGKINGANLIQVATGITSLSASLVAFAAGSAIGGIGGIIGTVSGAFSKLFGDGSLLDQLKVFAGLGTGLMIAGTGINMISSGLSNLSSALSSLKGVDTLKSIISTVNSLNVDKAIALSMIGSAIGLPKQTPASGTGIPALPKASAIDNLTSSPTKEDKKHEQARAKESALLISAGIEKSPTDTGINSMLGYQNSLLEQLLESTNSLVSTNKDILRYTRIQS
jgi:hypothetical protein